MNATLDRSGMPDHFGIRITSAEKDKLVGELDVDHRHLNRGGNVHGGALLAFADDLGGTLAGLHNSPGFRPTTHPSKNKNLRGLTPRPLTNVAQAGPARPRTHGAQNS